MPERRTDPVHQKIATYLLPIALGMCAYLGNNAFQRIQDQLTRIELKQSADQAQVTEIKTRIYALEIGQANSRSGFKLPNQN